MSFEQLKFQYTDISYKKHSNKPRNEFRKLFKITNERF